MLVGAYRLYLVSAAIVLFAISPPPLDKLNDFKNTIRNQSSVDIRLGHLFLNFVYFFTIILLGSFQLAVIHSPYAVTLCIKNFLNQ